MYPEIASAHQTLRSLSKSNLVSAEVTLPGFPSEIEVVLFFGQDKPFIDKGILNQGV